MRANVVSTDFVAHRIIAIGVSVFDVSLLIFHVSMFHCVHIADLSS